jgi:L-asparagine oxygenase
MRPIVETVLSASESAALSLWSRGFSKDLVCGSDYAACDRVIGTRINDIPERIQSLFFSFGECPDSAGVLHLRGLTVPDELPLTPNLSSGEASGVIGTEPVLLGIGLLVGKPISYPHLRRGERVHNVYPIADDAMTQKSSGSVLLDFHTEVAFRPNPPDALALFCLRAGFAPPPTLFSDLREVWEDLDANAQALLREPAFGLPGAGPDRMAKGIARQPVCVSCGDELRFQYDAGVRGTSPRHEAALASLRAGLKRAAAEFRLLAGDLVLIDNRRVVHGRASYSPGYEGGDRWLQRCLIRRR